MLTQSTERFTSIQKEAPMDCQKFLVQVTKYQAAKHCKVNLMNAPVLELYIEFFYAFLSKYYGINNLFHFILIYSFCGIVRHG